MQDNLAKDIRFYAKKADITFTKLTKKLFELDDITYKKCIVIIRRREMMRCCMRIKKIYEPTRNGTRIIFELVKNTDELVGEYVDIYKSAYELNMSPAELKEALDD